MAEQQQRGLRRTLQVVEYQHDRFFRSRRRSPGGQPDAEEQLVEAAGKLSLNERRDECQRVEPASLIDEDERHRRVHKRRRSRAWVRKGEGHFNAVLTPD
jgi:hypothetical protein